MLKIEKPVGADVDAHVAELVGPEGAHDEERHERDE